MMVFMFMKKYTLLFPERLKFVDSRTCLASYTPRRKSDHMLLQLFIIGKNWK